MTKIICKITSETMKKCISTFLKLTKYLTDNVLIFKYNILGGNEKKIFTFGHFRHVQLNIRYYVVKYITTLILFSVQALNISKCSLLGWSDGGISALVLSAKYPNIVDKVVIWGANAYVTDEDIVAYESM